MTEAKIVLEEGDRLSPERSVTVTGTDQDVAELIGLYSLARQCVRDRIKVKHFRKMILAAEDALLEEQQPQL